MMLVLFVIVALGVSFVAVASSGQFVIPALLVGWLALLIVGKPKS